MWFGLRLGYSCLYPCILAVSKTCRCRWASLWDTVSCRGTFSRSPAEIDLPCAFVNYQLSGPEFTEVSFRYPENFTQFEHVTNTKCVLKNFSAYWSKWSLFMNYSPCRKCSYKNHGYTGCLHWMKSRTRSTSVMYLYVCLYMGKDLSFVLLGHEAGWF